MLTGSSTSGTNLQTFQKCSQFQTETSVHFYQTIRYNVPQDRHIESPVSLPFEILLKIWNSGNEKKAYSILGAEVH